MEALLRGESLDTSIDARAATAYLIGAIEHVKSRLDEISRGVGKAAK
jgi:hypothetical protein